MNDINPYAAPTQPSEIDVAGHFPGMPSGSGNFKQILSSGLRLYINNIGLIALITAIVWIPLELIQAYMEYFVFDPDDMRNSFRLQRFLANCFGIIAYAAVIGVGAARFRGQPISLAQALDQGLTAWPRMFWTNIVYGFFLILAFLALILPGFYVMFRIAVLQPVVVIEHASGAEAIKRTFSLTKQSAWLMAGIMLLPYSATIFTSLLLSLPLVLFSEIDHWLLSATVSVLADILMQFPNMILVAAYFNRLHGAAMLPPQQPT